MSEERHIRPIPFILLGISPLTFGLMIVYGFVGVDARCGCQVALECW
jgi:hypothetical protein